MYQEFRIKIESREAGGFEVSASGPAGEVEGTFQVPLDEKDLRILILEMGVPRALVRGAEAQASNAARELGSKLYQSLFSGDVGVLFLRSRELAEAHGDRLRITLALTEVPNLMHFPWEYLYDEASGRFLAVSVRTPVVRYLEIPSQRRPMLVAPPLSILGMVSSPADVAELDSGVERENLEQALAGLRQQGLVEITWLEKASLDGLQEELRRGEYHVFHYIGHGGFDPREDESVLLLEGTSERSRYVSGEQLGTVLFDHTSLCLAVLNACEAARTSTRDPFAGVAASLVRQEIPAVIAMQFPITDSAAIRFSSEFYRALADGLPVDAAMAEARKAMYAGDPDNVEWGTPVLFMRVADGRVLELDRSVLPSPAPEEVLPPVVPPPPPDGEGGGEEERALPPPVPPPPDPSLLKRLTDGIRRHRLPVLAVLALVGVAVALGIILAGGSSDEPPPDPAAGDGEAPPSNAGGPAFEVSSVVPLGGDGATVGGYSPSWGDTGESVLYVQAQTETFDPSVRAEGDVFVDDDREIRELDAEATGAQAVTLVDSERNEYPSQSVTGEIVYQRFTFGEGANIYLLNNEVEKELVNEALQAATPSWSPDGEQVIFSLGNGRTEQWDLRIVEHNGGGPPAPLEGVPEEDAWHELFPVWSPDGTQLAFVRVRQGEESCPGGESELWLANYDAGELTDARVLVADFGDVRHPSWSPDGRQIVFSAKRDDQFRIYMVDTANPAEPVELETGLAGMDTVDPSWSSEGRIAFAAGTFDPCPLRWQPWDPWRGWGASSEIQILTLATG